MNPEPNPKDAAGRRKTPLRFVPPVLLIEAAHAYAAGAAKYGAFNWRLTKVNRSIYIEAALRHLLAMQDGEDLDPESGRSHAAHIAAGMGILLDAASLGMLIDDRFTDGAAAAVMRAG